LFDINDLYQLQDQHFQKISDTIEVCNEPYPHFEVENLFQPEFYQFIKLLMPDFGSLDRFRDLEGVPRHYSPHRYVFFIKASDTGHSRFFKKVHDPKMRYHYFRLYQWFSTTLSRKFLDLLGMNIRDMTHDEFAYVEDAPGFTLKAHTDIPQKIMTVLCYIPDDSSMIESGTNILVPKNSTVLEKLAKSDSDFDIIKTTKLIPNNTFCFRRSDYSFHNVTDNNQQGQRKFLLFTAMSVEGK
jgi:hypothetical protein